MPERRKNGPGFPVLVANHQRIVWQRIAMAADGSVSANKSGASQQKGRREAGLSMFRLQFAQLSISR
jgi:hypothetical protein